VKDSASAELASIRSRKQALGGTASSVLRRVMARAVEEGIIDSSATPAMRDGRLVLPLSPMHKRKMPGIVHDESATGKTIFIEPAEVVEVNNRMRELEMEERREINRILIATASLIRPHIPGLLQMAAVIGQLDFIHAKARYAVKVGGKMPRLSSEPDLEWYHARHPVMLAALESRGEEVVPLDITLNPANRILVISGPNAGGKSVVLKTVGVVQYMIQCGLLPPLYENSCAGIFEDIFIDIGDDQSIEDALSTYSSHLRNMKRLIASGGRKSLVLIDEFGAGTEPQIGGALAQAILFRLNQNGVWGVITTHFQNLKRFAEETPGLVNGSMLYDRREMKPLFKLVVGTAGSSFAIEIARNTGLPAEIIEMAQEIVGSDYVKMDRYLLDIARDRRYWDNKRNSIRVKEKKLDEILQQYESDAQTLRQKRREIIEEANTEAKHIIDSANATIERTVSEIRKAQAEREKTLEARRKLREDRVALEHVDTTADADNHP
ncbi:MAG: endonuclease MutS2, partial [Paramuribaculum sp.]|nr:endonuclease MutS2 [Paramuribaculum sp.]